MPESPRRFVISCGVIAVAAAPAFVRPVDIVTGPAIQPETFGSTFDGRPYHPA
jgi:hypothetical protein